MCMRMRPRAHTHRHTQNVTHIQRYTHTHTHTHIYKFDVFGPNDNDVMDLWAKVHHLNSHRLRHRGLSYAHSQTQLYQYHRHHYSMPTISRLSYSHYLNHKFESPPTARPQ